jgi:hypothetical protein
MNTNDVKEKEAVPTQESLETTQPPTEVSEDVKTPEDENVSKSVYEKVREAMKSEREAKRAAQAQNAELEERLAKLESQPRQEETGDYDPYKAKTDLLFQISKDEFVKENLDLIEAKMTDNPSFDVSQATTAVKAEIFDRIQKEANPVEPNKPLKQQKPTATAEPVRKDLSGDIYKDALAGKIDVDPAQLAAIQRHRPTKLR